MAEPLPRFNHVLAPVGVKSYLLSGQTDPFDEPKVRDRAASSPSVFNHTTKTWTHCENGIDIDLCRPPGLRCGGFVADGKYIYWFGGRHDTTSGRFNILMRFDTEKFEWSKFPPNINTPGEAPMEKAGCEPVIIDDKFCLFGGYGIPKESQIQPGSEFHQEEGAYNDRGNTNEFHIYDLKEGAPPRWISVGVTGERPPPCSYYTLTKMDHRRAVMFAGTTTKSRRNNDVYIMTLNGMNVNFEKMKKYGPWPKKRSSQAACILNYGQEFPQLLMTGGLDNNTSPLGDLWLLSIEHGMWTKLRENETYLLRWRPSLSCVPLDGGRKASVLLFGGVDKDGYKLAMTTVFEFKLSQNSGDVMEWTLDDFDTPGEPRERSAFATPIQTQEDGGDYMYV